MATIRKTITLHRAAGRIDCRTGRGRLYTNDSEATRDLIRREQERSTQVEALRQALIKGDASGEPRSFGRAAFKRRMTQRHG